MREQILRVDKLHSGGRVRYFKWLIQMEGTSLMALKKMVLLRVHQSKQVSSKPRLSPLAMELQRESQLIDRLRALI